MRQFVGALADQFDQLLPAVHRDAFNGEKLVLRQDAGAVGGRTRARAHRDWPARRIEAGHFDAEFFFVNRFEIAINPLVAAHGNDVDNRLQAQRDTGNDVRPFADVLAVELNDPVTGAQAGQFFVAVRLDPADHSRMVRRRQADAPEHGRNRKR